jgi:hypothetical protein
MKGLLSLAVIGAAAYMLKSQESEIRRYLNIKAM